MIAGEVLGEDELVRYGRDRLQKVVDHSRQHGGFSEYNSPPYTKVVIAECERNLALARDHKTRSAVESLRQSGLANDG